MVDKKKYYKLNETGIVGKQGKKSAASSYHSKKTAEAFREHRQIHTPATTTVTKRSGK